MHTEAAYLTGDKTSEKKKKKKKKKEKHNDNDQSSVNVFN